MATSTKKPRAIKPLVMNRRDYIKIAAEIRTEVSFAESFTNSEARLDTLRHIVEGLSTVFAADNPQFDTAKFAKDCGIAS